MIAVSLLVPLYFPAYAGHYLFLLLFLGFGLRPLLEVTGLSGYWERLEDPFQRRWSETELKKHRRAVEQRVRQAALKKRRYRDPETTPGPGQK